MYDDLAWYNTTKIEMREVHYQYMKSLVMCKSVKRKPLKFHYIVL
jgi:hypothetical protein